MLDPYGVFTYRDGVAVVQLFFFAIYLTFGFVICGRHGFRWSALVTFSILRILGAGFQLAAINHPTRSVYGGILICEGIGLGPLTLLNISLFARLNKLVHSINQRIFSFIYLVAVAAIVLAIWGGTRSANSPTLSSNDLLKASVILFLAAYAAYVCVFLIFLRQWHATPRGEQKLLICFACCVPFMVVRFFFGILGTFVESLRSEFSILFGNVTVFLLMAVIEEIIVVGLFVFTGMSLERLPPALRTGTRGRHSTVIPLRSRDQE